MNPEIRFGPIALTYDRDGDLEIDDETIRRGASTPIYIWRKDIPELIRWLTEAKAARDADMARAGAV